MSRRARALLTFTCLAFLCWLFTSTEPGVQPPGETLSRIAHEPTAVSSASPVTVQIPAHALISGDVRDTEGRPLAGAQVCAFLGEPPIFLKCTTTTRDGHYTLLLPPMRYSLAASAPRHISQLYKEGEGARSRLEIVVRAGDALAGIDFTLRGGAVYIEGVVRDLSGGGVEHAYVSVGFAHTISREDGSFSLWTAPGSVAAHASADGYVGDSDFGTAPGHRFELVLTPESALTGHAFHVADGRAAAFAHIRALRLDRGGAEYEGETDESGRFRIGGLLPGAYRVEATTDDGFGRSDEMTVLGFAETSLPIAIALNPSVLVEGVVSIDGRSPCPRGKVTLYGERTRLSRHASLTPDGIAAVRGLLADTYEVTVKCDGYLSLERYEPIVVENQPIRDVRWLVEQGGAIRGNVIDASAVPVERVIIDANMRPGTDGVPARARGQSTQTDIGGRFAFTGLLPGAYELTVDGWNGRVGPREATLVSLPESSDLEGVTIRLPPTGSMIGHVRTTRGPLDHRAQVALSGENPAGIAAIADDGSFRFEHLLPGEYQAVVIGARGSILSGDESAGGVPVRIRAGETSEVDIVVTAPDSRIRGRVIDADGAPLPDALVVAVPEYAGLDAAAARMNARSLVAVDPGSSALTDSEGSFVITGLADGPYTVHAERRGGGEGAARTVVPGADVLLALADPASVHGTVRLAHGGFPPRFTVRLTDTSSGFAIWDEFVHTEGRFSFPEVPPGPFTVTVEATEGTASTNISARSASVASAEIMLDPRLTVRGRLIAADTNDPIPGLMITISPRSGAHSRTPGVSSAVSDVHGNFSIAEAPAGDVSITVQEQDGVSPEYIPLDMLATLSPTDSTLMVQLPPIQLVRTPRRPEHTP